MTGTSEDQATSSLYRTIDAHNATLAGQLTPASQALVNAGSFTEARLEALGAVSPEVVMAPPEQVNLASFITTDLPLARPAKLRGERIKVEPVLEIFNLFNVASYDLPGNRLGATLAGVTGSINGSTAVDVQHDPPGKCDQGGQYCQLGVWRAEVMAHFGTLHEASADAAPIAHDHSG